MSHASDNHILLVPEDKYSYCTPYTPNGKPTYLLGIVGKDWALTFEIQVDDLSGKFLAKPAQLYRGPNMHFYIGRSAGPRRPPLPKTKAYTKIELARISGDIQRIKLYDKVMGPIEIVVDDFTLINQQFHISGKVNTACLGPLP